MRLLLNFLQIKILIFIILSTSNAFASYDDEHNVCNLVSNPKRVTETWNGKTKEYISNAGCMPWNKGVGRQAGSCLLQFDRPIPAQRRHNACAQKATSNTYSNPQINLRVQSCAIECTQHNHNLNWDGDCVAVPTGEVYPVFTRYCARITVSNQAEYQNFKGKHLNSEGVLKNDKPIYDADGIQIDLDLPKLCIFEDPYFWAGGLHPYQRLDPFEFQQPFHKTDVNNPIVRELTRIGKNIEWTDVNSLKAVLKIMIKNENNALQSNDVVGKVYRKQLEHLIDLINSALHANDVKEDLANINAGVGRNLGCVNLPLGPFPPPYPNNLSDLPRNPTVQSICTTDLNGKILGTDRTGKTNTPPCVISKMPNNFIHNAVRVSQDKLVPLCKNGENPQETDSCVAIENIPLTPSYLHNYTNGLDILPKASINTSIDHRCDVVDSQDIKGCKDGFRLVYGYRLSKDLADARYYYDKSKIDCNDPEDTGCQFLWGINTGQFADVAIEITDPSDIGVKVKNFDLSYYNGSNKKTDNLNFNLIAVTTKDQSSSELCVFKNSGKIVNCVNRVDPPIPVVESLVPPESTYFEPSMKASLKSYALLDASGNANLTGNKLQEFSLSKIVKADTVRSDSKVTFNIAGRYFQSFVMDKNYLKTPFVADQISTNNNIVNDYTILGNYRDNISAYTIKGNRGLIGNGEGLLMRTNEQEEEKKKIAKKAYAVYYDGLEIIMSKYNLGGKYFCLSTNDINKCSSRHKESCVLTKLLNKDIVSCHKFFQKTNGQNLSLCSTFINQGFTCNEAYKISNENGVEIPVELNRKNGGNKVKFFNCTKKEQHAICYENNELLCIPSKKPEDRIDPVYDKNDPKTLIIYEKYYDIDNFDSNTDSETSAFRDKTFEEWGSCVKIPQSVSIPSSLPSVVEPIDYIGTCPEEALNEVDVGNDRYDFGGMIWPSEVLNRDSTPRCPPDLIMEGQGRPRRCVPDPETSTFKLEPAIRYTSNGTPQMPDYKCIVKSVVKSVVKNVVKKVCSKFTWQGSRTELVDSTYIDSVTWPSVSIGEYSQGYCNSGSPIDTIPKLECMERNGRLHFFESWNITGPLCRPF